MNRINTKLFCIIGRRQRNEYNGQNNTQQEKHPPRNKTYRGEKKKNANVHALVQLPAKRQGNKKNLHKDNLHDILDVGHEGRLGEEVKHSSSPLEWQGKLR